MGGDTRLFPGYGILELLDTRLDQEEMGKKNVNSFPSLPPALKISFHPPASATLENYSRERKRNLDQGASSNSLTLG